MQIKEVVQRINYFRNEQKLSARELSLLINKHEGYINKLECYNFNLSTNMLLQIIDALGISPEQFFAENYRTYKKDNDLYNTIKNLPESKKESLLKFIKS